MWREVSVPGADQKHNDMVAELMLDMIVLEGAKAAVEARQRFYEQYPAAAPA